MLQPAIALALFYKAGILAAMTMLSDVNRIRPVSRRGSLLQKVYGAIYPLLKYQPNQVGWFYIQGKKKQ